MSTKGCLKEAWPVVPPAEYDIAIGDTVTLLHRVYNCGSDDGYVYAWLKEDDHVLAASPKKWCTAGDTSCYAEARYSYKMPNKATVDIHYIARHAGPPDWKIIEDYDKVLTLKAIQYPTDLTCYDKSTKVGESVDLEAKLQMGVEPRPPIEGKKIKFYVDDSYVDYDYTDSEGIAKVSYTPDSAGTFTIKAEFAGDAGYYSSSCTATLTVSEVKKDTTLTCYDRSCQVGSGINLRATLKEATDPYSPVSGRTVKFYVGGSYVGSDSTDVDGDALIPSYTCGAAGTYTIECVFEGDAAFNSSSCTATLTITKPTCDQLVKVVDPALNPIEDATVEIDMGTYCILCEKPDKSGWGTDADGLCYLRNLDINTIYNACASKEGYERYGTEGCKLFTACTELPVILTLYKPCAQGWLVSDQDGNPVEGATVTVTPVDKTCTTNADGWCEVTELSEGLSYHAEATKEGYECYDSECGKDFECVPSTSLPLKLSKIKKDTKLTCTDPTKTAKVGDTIDLEVKLEESAFPYYDLEGKTINYYKDDSETPFGTCTKTDSDGKCSVQYICPIEETFTVTAKFEGDADYNSSSCTFSVTVSKYDTVICNFSVRDSDDNEVTELFAGKQYTVKAWLCWKDAWGACGVNQCFTGHEIPNEELKLFLFGQKVPLASGTTDSNGYTAMFWTPSEDIGSPEGLDNNIRLEYAGTAKYNACETDWKTVTVKTMPYKINVTVKDENGNLLEGAYVDIDEELVLGWSEKRCQDVVVYKGECVSDEFKGDADNIKTDANGEASFGLPELPVGEYPDKYRFRAGKDGYLNPDMHEDWTDFEEITQLKHPPGTYNFEFTLTFITEEDAFIISTRGTKAGDSVLVFEPLPYTECFIRNPLGFSGKKKLLAPEVTVTFDKSDGLEEGKEYAIGIAVNVLGVDFFTGPGWCGEFRGTREITIYRYGVFSKCCDVMGIDPASDECRRFWEEMADPVYVADCILGVFKGEDIHGDPYKPGAFELAMLPVVVVCAFLPMVPGATITKRLGKLLRKADEVEDVAKYFDDSYMSVYRIQVYGDKARLANWAKAVEDGDLAEARKWMYDILEKPAVTDAKAVDNFNSWLDELERQIDNIDPKQVDEIADLTRKVKKVAGSVIYEIGTQDLRLGDGKRLAELLYNNWDGAFKLARRAEFSRTEGTFFDVYEIVTKGEDLDGNLRVPSAYHYAVIITAFNKANRVGDFSKTGMLLSEAAAYSDSAIKEYIRDAFSTKKFWHFWRVADDATKADYVRLIADGELGKAADMLDIASEMKMVPDNVVAYADELEDASSYFDPDTLWDILEDSSCHSHYREELETLATFPDSYAKLLDEAYPAYIDTLRYGDMEKNVMVFIKAADALCSPAQWKCKFTIMAAKDKLRVGRAVLDMPEYTKFLYKHGATTPGHAAFIDSLRFLAVSDESNILSLKTIMEADDWTAFQRWLEAIKLKFDWDYVGQVNFFDNERLRILAQWSAERVDDIMGSSGFRDEATRMLGDMIKNPSEAKRVIDTQTVEMVGVGTVQEPSKAAEFFAKAHSIATPNTLYPDSLFGILVPGNVAADLKYLGDIERARKWWNTYAKAAKDYPQVAEYLKNNKALVVEAFGKGELSKLDEFSELIARGDTTGAHKLLNEAITGTPSGSADKTYHIVFDTEELADAEPEVTRSAVHRLVDEVCENFWTKVAKVKDDLKRVVDSLEKASLTQIFRRGARRIIDRTSGGLMKLRRKAPEMDTPYGDLWTTTMRDGEVISQTYKMPPKEARSFFWRHWKKIGGIVTAAVILVPWWGVDNAVFMVWMGRKFGWLEPGWAEAWEDAYWDIKTADERLDMDPCVEAHQTLYVNALERWRDLLKVDPVTPEQQESWLYYYKVAWAIEPSRPTEALKESCWAAFNSANERYFQIVQHCPSPVEPSFGFAITEMPEEILGLSSTIEDADTLYVVPPDELPTGDEFYWEHGSPILVRLLGINAPEGPNYKYGCTEKKEPWLVRRLTTPGEECISEELWYVDSIFYAQANAWLANQLPEHTHVTLRSDNNRQWLTKHKKIRFLAVVYKGTTNIDVEELKAGYAVLFIVDKNKHVWDTINNKIKDEYVNAENEAKLKKTRIWDPKWRRPCPATEVWFDYSPPLRVGQETTFFGWVDCELSEITDWKWYLPGDVVKEGRVVTYTPDKEWKGKIRLEICAGALDESRDVTVQEPYPDKASPCAPYGDVNKDGYVNDLDAKLVSDYVDHGWDAVKGEVGGLTEKQFKDRADVNADGVVDVDDVALIYAYHAGDTKSPHFPACPAPCPPANANFSYSPPSPVVGETVTFTCSSSGGDTRKIIRREWSFGDGKADKDNNAVVTHKYSTAGKYSVTLKVTNDCGDDDTATKTITVSAVVPPADKGNLTIMVSRNVAVIRVDDIVVGRNTSEVTKKDLLVSDNPHKVEINAVEGEDMTCYADLPDYCGTPCMFDVDVVKDKTVTVNVRPAHTCLFISDPPGATVYIKQVDEPDTAYVEIPTSAHTLPVDTYSVKFMNLSGYGELKAVVTVGEDGVTCENVIDPPYGNCYTSTPVTRPGLLVTGFLIKAYPEEVVTKTVTFESVPADATVQILD